MILLNNDIKSKYILIYSKLIELKKLLNDKIEYLEVDWAECVNDSNINITWEDLQTNSNEQNPNTTNISFTELIKCLVHTNYYSNKLQVTDYNGYQIINIHNNIFNEDSNNKKILNNGLIHERDYWLVDRIYYYTSFLRWFLQQTNVSQNKINEAKTLKALILLLDEVQTYENVDIIIPTDDNGQIKIYTNIKSALNYSFISLKTKQEIDIPLCTLQCTSENSNVSFQITDVQEMNWTVEDHSYQIQDGVEYWIYDFYLYAKNPIPDEQFYDIRCNYSFLLVNVVRTQDKQGLHIYSTPYAYPKLGQNDLFRIQLPKHIVKGKIYDMIEVCYRWGEYTLMYPLGQTDTGFFITPVINENLPQDIECTLTFNGYKQYRPMSKNFTITVHENPYVLTYDIINNNIESEFYQSNNEGNIDDKWIINIELTNWEGTPIVGKEVFLKIEDEEPFASLLTDDNGLATYNNYILYCDEDFIDSSEKPDQIKLYTDTNGNIDFTHSQKIYQKEYNDITHQFDVVYDSLYQNEITKIENQYYYIDKKENKYPIIFVSDNFINGEIGEIDYTTEKKSLILTLFTDFNPVYDVSVTTSINIKGGMILDGYFTAYN